MSDDRLIVALDLVLPYGIAFKLVSVLGILTLPLAAQTTEVLLLQLGLESELLVQDLSRYRRARNAERDALARLEALASQVDGQLQRDNLPLDELRRSEGELDAGCPVQSRSSRLRASTSSLRSVSSGLRLPLPSGRVARCRTPRSYRSHSRGGP